jgi:hypothetical protein
MTTLLLFSLRVNAQEIQKTDIYRFKAKIKSITIVEIKNALYVYDYSEFESRKSGSVFVTNIDSHWAIAMEILSVDNDRNALKKGEQITFIVHSPIRNMGISEKDAIGKDVKLKLHITYQEKNAVTLDIYPDF